MDFPVLLLLFLVHAASAQQLYYTTSRPPAGELIFGNCSVLADNDSIVGMYDQFSDRGLLPSLFISRDGNAPPFLRIVRSKVTCLNSGLLKNTASSVGILVEYQRQSAPNTSIVAQVAVDCIEDPYNLNANFSFYPTPIPNPNLRGYSKNTARVSSGSTLQDNVSVPFSAALRTNCSICSNLIISSRNPESLCVGKPAIN